MRLLYLAAPYTHQSPVVREWREESTTSTAAIIMRLTGQAVYSPLTHGHRIAPYLPNELVLDHEFWMQQCLPLLRMADELLVLPLEGWRESAGVRKEISVAQACLIPVNFLDLGHSDLFDFPPPAELNERGWAVSEIAFY